MDSQEKVPQPEVDVEKRLSEFTEHSSTPAANSSGVTHQSELGQTKRGHFFSPLDLKHAQAVNLDAEEVQYTREEDASVASLLQQIY